MYPSKKRGAIGWTGYIDKWFKAGMSYSVETWFMRLVEERTGNTHRRTYIHDTDIQEIFLLGIYIQLFLKF